MAKSRTPQDKLKEAVERTVQQAGQATRERAQGAVGDIAQRAERVRGAIEGSRPATHDDLAEVRKELRAIGRRLDKIEKALDKK